MASAGSPYRLIIRMGIVEQKPQRESCNPPVGRSQALLDRGQLTPDRDQLRLISVTGRAYQYPPLSQKTAGPVPKLGTCLVNPLDQAVP